MFVSQWFVVRLELGQTPEFPQGSACRAYMLRLPLRQDGTIDRVAIARNPAMATVRRFWPNEPDQRGYLVRRGKGWAFSYAIGDEDDETAYNINSHPIVAGQDVMLTEADGTCLPFRVVQMEDA